MNSETIRELSQATVLDSKAQGDASLLCEHCGAASGIRVGDVVICENCYASVGSCCAAEIPEVGE